MLDPGVGSFVLGSLPPAPARVLEVGAGDGELAAGLVSNGYDVVAIDPASTRPAVRPVALHELTEPPGSFDAAVAVVSMHHVEPLAESCRRLGEVVRAGGALVLDEIDVARFDEAAAGWWLEHHELVAEHEHDPESPEEIVAWLRHHCHDLPTAGGWGQDDRDQAARPGVKHTAWQLTPSPTSSASAPAVLRSCAIS